MIPRSRSRSYSVRRMPRIYGNVEPRYAFSLRSLWINVRRLAVVLIVGAAAYFIFFGPAFQIKTVTVEGAVFYNQAGLQGSLPYGKNIWRLDRQPITTPIVSDPAVESVSILRGLPDELRIVVQEKKPVMIWRSGTALCVLDSLGYCMRQYQESDFPDAETPIGKKLTNLPRVTDIIALPAKAGSQLVSPIFIEFVNAAGSNLAGLLPAQPVDRWEVSGTTYDITAIFKNGMQVQMSTLADAGVQSRNLARLVQQNKVTPSSVVDLRVNRWAFVR